uniref:ORF2 n=1 Tax=Bemisia tabaci nege-like virus 1 TaxID=2840071 RepID=A0A8E8KRP7_9VIRU|nr:ORF2 [Bemisia tabaci nege-like virus 1]
MNLLKTLSYIAEFSGLIPGEVEKFFFHTAESTAIDRPVDMRFQTHFQQTGSAFIGSIVRDTHGYYHLIDVPELLRISLDYLRTVYLSFPDVTNFECNFNSVNTTCPIVPGCRPLALYNRTGDLMCLQSTIDDRRVFLHEKINIHAKNGDSLFNHLPVNASFTYNADKTIFGFSALCLQGADHCYITSDYCADALPNSDNSFTTTLQTSSCRLFGPVQRVDIFYYLPIFVEWSNVNFNTYTTKVIENFSLRKNEKQCYNTPVGYFWIHSHYNAYSDLVHDCPYPIRAITFKSSTSLSPYYHRSHALFFQTITEIISQVESVAKKTIDYSILALRTQVSDHITHLKLYFLKIFDGLLSITAVTFSLYIFNRDLYICAPIGVALFVIKYLNLLGFHEVNAYEVKKEPRETSSKDSITSFGRSNRSYDYCCETRFRPSYINDPLGVCRCRRDSLRVQQRYYRSNYQRFDCPLCYLDKQEFGKIFGISYFCSSDHIFTSESSTRGIYFCNFVDLFDAEGENCWVYIDGHCYGFVFQSKNTSTTIPCFNGDCRRNLPRLSRV